MNKQGKKSVNVRRRKDVKVMTIADGVRDNVAKKRRGEKEKKKSADDANSFEERRMLDDTRQSTKLDSVPSNMNEKYSANARKRKHVRRR